MSNLLWWLCATLLVQGVVLSLLIIFNPPGWLDRQTAVRGRNSLLDQLQALLFALIPLVVAIAISFIIAGGALAESSRYLPHALRTHSAVPAGA